MSNSNTDELPNTGWFDLESDFPGISSVDPTIELGVKMGSPSANMTLARALEIGDSHTTGPQYEHSSRLCTSGRDWTH